MYSRISGLKELKRSPVEISGRILRLGYDMYSFGISEGILIVKMIPNAF